MSSTIQPPDDEAPSFRCTVCGRCYNDPRLLPCLHTFCAQCIAGLDPYDPKSPRDSRTSFYNASFTTAEFDNEKSHRISFNSTQTIGSETRPEKERGKVDKTILCPACDLEVDIPLGGVNFLPPNYVLRHQMTLRALDSGQALVICDLCTDGDAVIRCLECPALMCSFCSEAHRRQRKTNRHVLISISEERKDAAVTTVMTLNRKLICDKHQHEELSLFCETCSMTACRDCCLIDHRGHCCRFISDVGDRHKANLQSMIAQLKPQTEAIRLGLVTLSTDTQRFGDEVNISTDEMNHHIDRHVRALEEHRRRLVGQIEKIKEEKQRMLKLQQIQLEQALEDITGSTEFASQLLNHDSVPEILALIAPVKKRLQDLYQMRHGLMPKVDLTLKFLPQNRGLPLVDGLPVSGTMTTQCIAPSNSILRGNGLQAARQGMKCDALLVAHSENGQPLSRGGDEVKAELISKEDILMHIPVDVHDRLDGTYLLSFCPEQMGLYSFHIKIYGNHIKGSPFQVVVKPKWRPHTGIFHCCSFCSSGGSKDARCACGGTMPGGYKGCGHNHKGHPGHRHWSCCGKVVEKTECVRPVSMTYQFTI